MDAGTMFLVEFLITLVVVCIMCAYSDKKFDAEHPDAVVKKQKEQPKEA